MRTPRTQANRAFDAVRRRHRRGRVRSRHRARPSSAVMATSPRTIDLVLHVVDDQPPVRVELVAAATARLATGDRPSPEAIADRAIERALCDLSV